MTSSPSAHPARSAEPAPEHLVDEALILSRYLVAREAGPELIDRYARGCQVLFGNAARRQETAMMAFVRRHGWSLPFLDAACALVSPDSLLRGRLLLMLSILETTPQHCGRFLAKPRGRIVLFLLLAFRGLLAIVKAAGGLVLMPVARHSREGHL